jgi:hypothetical protein
LPLSRLFALDWRECPQDLFAAITAAAFLNDANHKRLRWVLAVQEAWNAQHPANVLGVLVGAIARHHALHDGREVGPALLVGRPVVRNKPIPMEVPRG